MTSITVNHQQMIIAADNLVAAANKMNNRLDRLESFVQKKIDGGWVGDQKDSYLQAKAQWDRIIADMQAHLPMQAAQVRASSEAFTATDKAAAARFGGISVPK